MGRIPASAGRRGARIGALGATMVMCLCVPAIAPADPGATINVTSSLDRPLAADMTCATPAGDQPCTLRAALQAASQDPSDADITVSVPAGTYELTLAQSEASPVENG